MSTVSLIPYILLIFKKINSIRFKKHILFLFVFYSYRALCKQLIIKSNTRILSLLCLYTLEILPHVRTFIYFFNILYILTKALTGFAKECYVYLITNSKSKSLKITNPISILNNETVIEVRSSQRKFRYLNLLFYLQRLVVSM